MNFVLDKNILVKYIIMSYYKKTKTKISPIKVQKALYILYGFYGKGYLEEKKENFNCEEYLFSEFTSQYLFDANFEAWGYGPVDNSVFEFFKNISIGDIKKINIKIKELHKSKKLIDFIDNQLNSIFNTNDFALVDYVQDDLSWKKAYKLGCKTKINNNSIIEDYILRK